MVINTCVSCPWQGAGSVGSSGEDTLQEDTRGCPKWMPTIPDASNGPSTGHSNSPQQSMWCHSKNWFKKEERNPLEKGGGKKEWERREGLSSQSSRRRRCCMVEWISTLHHMEDSCCCRWIFLKKFSPWGPHTRGEQKYEDEAAINHCALDVTSLATLHYSGMESEIKLTLGERGGNILV